MRLVWSSFWRTPLLSIKYHKLSWYIWPLHFPPLRLHKHIYIYLLHPCTNPYSTLSNPAPYIMIFASGTMRVGRAGYSHIQGQPWQPVEDANQTTLGPIRLDLSPSDQIIIQADFNLSDEVIIKEEIRFYPVRLQVRFYQIKVDTVIIHYPSKDVIHSDLISNICRSLQSF